MSKVSNERVEIQKSQRDAYTATNYEVQLASGATAVIRIGQPLPAALQTDIGAGHSVSVVTAWNPFSGKLDDPEENRKRNQAQNAILKKDLEQRCLMTLEAVGWDGQVNHKSEDVWREESFAVLDADRATLDALLVEYGQNAVVHVPAGGVAELVFHPRAVHVDG
jgi:hypothetical protein